MWLKYFLPLLFLSTQLSYAQTGETFAQRLGWGANDRVVIFHVDDVGMSHSSNLGAVESLENGVATSWSLMMPCPWIPEAAAYLKEHPEVDAGLHLTLTSEWKLYRWGPLAGSSAVPGLTDPEGCLWPSVAEVVAHATPDEVEKEMRAQIERAEKLGIPITHLDSHMGTIFANEEYFKRYFQLGVEKGLPILIAGGHLTFVAAGMPEMTARLRAMAEMVWQAGLPVIDDIHTPSYGWSKEDKTDRFIDFMKSMKPGITEIIVHASRPTDVFAMITDSGESRLGDTLALVDPKLRQVIEEEGIILTTWRELMERRKKVGN